jgi:hypothetical protein
VTNRIPKILSSCRLSRHVDDLAVNVVQPAVIDASEPSLSKHTEWLLTSARLPDALLLDTVHKTVIDEFRQV